MDGILNALYRSTNPFYTKSFEEKVQHFLVFPKTQSIDKKDFDAPTCYYSCDEKGCDFSACTQKANETSYPHPDVEKFTKGVIEKHSKCFPIAYNMNGVMISYTPEKSDNSKTVICMMNQKNQENGRIGVIELNETRLKMMNS
jgi:hypothetical protein